MHYRRLFLFLAFFLGAAFFLCSLLLGGLLGRALFCALFLGGFLFGRWFFLGSWLFLGGLLFLLGSSASAAAACGSRSAYWSRSFSAHRFLSTTASFGANRLFLFFFIILFG